MSGRLAAWPVHCKAGQGTCRQSAWIKRLPHEHRNLHTSAHTNTCTFQRTCSHVCCTAPCTAAVPHLLRDVVEGRHQQVVAPPPHLGVTAAWVQQGRGSTQRRARAWWVAARCHPAALQCHGRGLPTPPPPPHTHGTLLKASAAEDASCCAACSAAVCARGGAGAGSGTRAKRAAGEGGGRVC